MNPGRRWIFSVVLGALTTFLVSAGTLEPPGPVAPTMVTLQQIYDAVTTAPGVPGGLQPPPGAPFPTMVTMQGISEQIGINRFTDRGNGTVKDNVTGFIWLRNANCMSANTFQGANQAAAQLGEGTPDGVACGLTDGSVPGDWHLPTAGCIPSAFLTSCTSANAHNLETAGGEFTTIFGPGCPTRPVDATGMACLTEGNPFVGALDAWFWSSYNYSIIVPGSGVAIDLSNGAIFPSVQSNMLQVWPVRRGP